MRKKLYVMVLSIVLGTTCIGNVITYANEVHGTGDLADESEVYEEYVTNEKEDEDKSVLLGDFDRDGVVALKDAREVLRGALNLTTIEEDKVYTLDMNDDGQVTLADAQEVLRVALNLEEYSYYSTLDAELIYEGVVDNGMNCCQVYTEDFDVWEVCNFLMQHGMDEAVDILFNYPSEKSEGKKLYLSAKPVYGETLQDVTIEAVTHHGGTGTVHYTMTDYAGDVQDVKKNSYVQLFWIDESVHINEEKCASQVISDNDMGVICFEITGGLREDAICTSRDELKQAIERCNIVEEQQYEWNRILDTMDEEFFEEYALLIDRRDILDYEEDNLTQLEVVDNEENLILNITNTTRKIPRWHSYGWPDERTKRVVYFVKVPKELVADKEVEVNVLEDTMYGYENKNDIQLITLDTWEEYSTYHKVTVTESKIKGEHPMDDLDGEIRKLNLTKEHEEQLYKALEKIDFTTQDAVIIPVDIDTNKVAIGEDGIGTYTGTLLQQQYKGVINLAFEEHWTDRINGDYLCVVPIDKRLVHFEDVQIETFSVNEGRAWN